MDCTVTTADRTFRDEVRTWLRENVSGEPQPAELCAMREYDLAWQRAQYAVAGLGSAGQRSTAAAG